MIRKWGVLKMMTIFPLPLFLAALQNQGHKGRALRISASETISQLCPGRLAQFPSDYKSRPHLQFKTLHLSHLN